MTKTRAKTAIEVLLLGVVAAFVSAIAIGIFVDLFWGADTKPTEAFRGAFLGALFAFIFVRVGEALNRMYQTARESRRALAAVQFNLNEALSIGSDNLFVLEQWNLFYQVMSAGGQSVPVFANRLKPIPGSRDVLINLSSNGLINELFLLETTIRKLNDSMETWQRSYELVRDRFTAKQMNRETYIANVERTNAAAMELAKYATGLMEEAMNALTATRLLLGDKPFLSKLYTWLNPDKYAKSKDPARSAELEKLREEIKQISEASRARIRAVTAQDSATKLP